MKKREMGGPVHVSSEANQLRFCLLKEEETNLPFATIKQGRGASLNATSEV